MPPRSAGGWRAQHPRPDDAKEAGLAAAPRVRRVPARLACWTGCFASGRRPSNALDPGAAARAGASPARSMRDRVRRATGRTSRSPCTARRRAGRAAGDRQAVTMHADGGAGLTVALSARAGAGPGGSAGAGRCSGTLPSPRATAPGRYYRLSGPAVAGQPGRPRGRCDGLRLVDEWLGVGGRVWLEPGRRGRRGRRWRPCPCRRRGFERIYQGSSILLAWPLQLGPRRDLGAHPHALAGRFSLETSPSLC